MPSWRRRLSAAWHALFVFSAPLYAAGDLDWDAADGLSQFPTMVCRPQCFVKASLMDCNISEGAQIPFPPLHLSEALLSDMKVHGAERHACMHPHCQLDWNPTCFLGGPGLRFVS